jgi:multidrug efflux pump subunit AcrB
MWIIRLALNRPYTFVVAALLLLLVTPFVLIRTPTDIFPSINIPVVSIIWSYTGLSAREIEQRIIYTQERALTTTVNNIEHIESTSYDGIGIIKLYFQPGVTISTAVAQVTAVSQTILRQLPPGSTPPLIIQYDAATVPVLQYGVGSNTLSEQQTFDITLNQIRVGLVSVPGIPYWSSHLDGAESELIVNSDHGAQYNQQAIREVERILKENLTAKN